MALLVISLAAGAMATSSALSQLFYRISIVWALLLLISGGMAWLALRNVKIRRTARSLRSQVGLVFEERFEIQNLGRWPRIWIEVRDLSLLPGARGSHILTMIGGREGRSYLARTRLQTRGVFPLGPTVLVSGDLFGLFPVRKEFPNQDALLVYPPMFDIFSFPNPPGLLPGGESLRRRTPQITSNAAGVRDYVQGDPLNRIHWASTARRDRLIVKEFELDPLAEVWIFVDANQGMHSRLPHQPPEYDPQDFWRKRAPIALPPATEEYAVSIAASLARYYIQKGRAVGMVAASQILQVLPADRGVRQLNKILESLSLLRAEGRLPFEALVDAQARHMPRGSTVILITTSAEKGVLTIADILLRRGHHPVALVIDSTTFGGYSTAEKLVASLRFLSIPTCQVSYGDDLAQMVSTTLHQPNLL